MYTPTTSSITKLSPSPTAMPPATHTFRTAQPSPMSARFKAICGEDGVISPL
jgi:hypothetical protein